MVFIEPRRISIEGLKPSEYLTVTPIDPSQPSVIEDSMPDQTTLQVKTQNVKIVELNFPSYLANRGLSPSEISNYISTISLNANQFKIYADVETPFFLTLHIPKQWKVRRVTVDGKEPDVYVYDAKESVVFIGLTETSSPVEMILQLAPTIQTTTDMIVSFISGLMLTALIMSVAKKLWTTLRKR